MVSKRAFCPLWTLLTSLYLRCFFCMGLLPVAQFLQAFKHEALCCLLAWWVTRPEIFCALCDWLTNWPSAFFYFPNSILKTECFFSTKNPPADNRSSSIKRMEVLQVLHGLRRFGTAERGWHLGVEGHCPDVVAFGVMIMSPWEGALYGSGGEQIVFSSCCFFTEREQKKHPVGLFKKIPTHLQ